MTHHEPTSELVKHLSPFRGLRVVVGSLTRCIGGLLSQCPWRDKDASARRPSHAVALGQSLPRRTRPHRTHPRRATAPRLRTRLRALGTTATFTRSRCANATEQEVQELRERDLNPTERLSWLTALGITLRARDGRRVSGSPPSATSRSEEMTSPRRHKFRHSKPLQCPKLVATPAK